MLKVAALERKKIAMGLDAFVYCDCFEKQNLRCDPPAGLVVKIESSGEPNRRAATSSTNGSPFRAWKR